jgi:hypothetical protein
LIAAVVGPGAGLVVLMWWAEYSETLLVAHAVLPGQAGPDTYWQIGAAHPFRLDAYCAARRLKERAVATSAPTSEEST